MNERADAAFLSTSSILWFVYTILETAFSLAFSQPAYYSGLQNGPGGRNLQQQKRNVTRMISLILAEKIFSLFLIMFMGYAVVHWGLLHAEDSKTLSLISLYLISPCVIISAFQVQYTPDVLHGLLLALAAALMWAVYSILIKKYTEQYDNFLVTRRVMLWAFITAVPLMLLTDGMPDLHPLFTQTNVLLSWLFLGVFGNAVCFAIWNIAFQRLGVVITNNYLYASPFVTLVVGYLLLDEQITVMSVIGAVLITVGVIVALKKPKETV